MDSGLRHKTPGEIGLRRLCPVHGAITIITIIITMYLMLKKGIQKLEGLVVSCYTLTIIYIFITSYVYMLIRTFML